MKPEYSLILPTFSVPYINSGYLSGVRFEQAFETLEAGLRAGKIWNQEFLNAKYYIAGGCEHAQHVASSPARERDAKGNAKFYGSRDVRNDIGCAFSMNQCAKLSRRLKKLSVTDSTPEIRSYIAVLDQINTIWKYLQSFKAIIVKGRRPIDKTPEQIADEIANVGTCCICHKGQKLDADQNMVHHGYQMSDYNHSGYRVGSCFGVKYLPYEFSCEANKLWLSKFLKPELKSRKEYLTRLNASLMPTLSRTREVYKAGSPAPELVIDTFNKGTHEYEQQRGYEIGTTEFEINNLKAHIAFHTDKVATWTLQPLADGTTLKG